MRKTAIQRIEGVSESCSRLSLVAVAAWVVIGLSLTPITLAAPPITAAAFSPDGRSVLIASQAGIEIRSWPDLKSLRQIPTRLKHVHDLAFSPTADTLAAAGGTPGESGELELFKWPSGEPVAHHKSHHDLVYQIAWRPDGRGWATAGADKSVLLQDASGNITAKLVGHSSGVLAVQFLPDGKSVLSAGIDQSVRLWDAGDGKLLRTLDNHTAAVRDLAVRPSIESGVPMVASAGADRTVRLWQPTIGRLVRFARLPSEPLDIDWTPDGTRLLAACIDGHVRAIDPDTIQILADIPAIEGWAYTIVAAPDGRHLLVGGEGGQLRAIVIDALSP
jgi:WD40 repeat protein